jgi:hypothetical protein
MVRALGCVRGLAVHDRKLKKSADLLSARPFPLSLQLV